MTRESSRVRRLPWPRSSKQPPACSSPPGAGRHRIPAAEQARRGPQARRLIQHQQPPGPDKPAGPGRSIRAVPLHCPYGIGSRPPRVSDQAERSQPQLSSAFRTPMRVPSGVVTSRCATWRSCIRWRVASRSSWARRAVTGNNSPIWRGSAASWLEARSSSAVRVRVEIVSQAVLMSRSSALAASEPVPPRPVDQ